LIKSYKCKFISKFLHGGQVNKIDYLLIIWLQKTDYVTDEIYFLSNKIEAGRREARGLEKNEIKILPDLFKVAYVSRGTRQKSNLSCREHKRNGANSKGPTVKARLM
jgi:hypothetical protein